MNPDYVIQFLEVRFLRARIGHSWKRWRTQTIGEKKNKKCKKLYLFFNPVLLIISLLADASTYILIIAVKTKFSLFLAKKK